MGRVRWSKNARRREVERYEEGHRKTDAALKVFGKLLDDLSAKWEASTPAERELLRKKMLADVGQVD